MSAEQIWPDPSEEYASPQAQVTEAYHKLEQSILYVGHCLLGEEINSLEFSEELQDYFTLDNTSYEINFDVTILPDTGEKIISSASLAIIEYETFDPDLSLKLCSNRFVALDTVDRDFAASERYSYFVDYDKETTELEEHAVTEDTQFNDLPVYNWDAAEHDYATFSDKEYLEIADKLLRAYNENASLDS